MSITFAANNTPMVIADTFECQCAWYDGTPADDCSECEGTGEVVFEEPEGSFNCHNVGGAALCRLLDLECEYGSGSVERVQFPMVRRTILSARNRRGAIQAHTTAGYELPGGHAGTRVITDEYDMTRIQSMGARAVSGGLNESYFNRNLDSFERLLDVAERCNSDYISWG